MSRFAAYVQGMKVDEQRSVGPWNLGMELKEFQDFADCLLGVGHAVGDMTFIGKSPHHESQTGNRYIDMLKVERII